MDFVGYAERAAMLANASLGSVDDVRDHLAEREWLVPQVTDRDVRTLQRFQRRLRPVFEHGGAGRAADVVVAVNTLLATHRITPLIVPTDIAATDTGTSPSGWRLHVADRAASVADLLVAESLMGIAILVCDLDPGRLGVCAAHGCANTYVDTSPNRSRRYCSDRCSSRANVAAYRARKRAGAAANPRGDV
ncbi:MULTISPECIES: CGNR zinc finger domain-containing protein [Mumia]|uniref:CGNR zinc finger domain-containing protein n=1 Tax=Mumia TaxID=1546255 RepID=UPI00142039F6|nr:MULTISPECIES: CGNR zinc finger domain-containing protein [unclassified Mumia]QMW67033.1 CGNR zinc finger domain-containing protein [Mumia sp. ZJ1417]